MRGRTKKTQRAGTLSRPDEIKLALEKQKAVLLAESGAIITGGLNPGHLTYPDLTDQAAAEAHQNFTLRLREREQKLLRKIDEALDRITNGQFGICERCGEEISYRRLKARPVTTLCITCKTLQEDEEEKSRQ